MPRDLKKEIEHHLATFPERHEQTLEMRREWAAFKAKALWLMVGFISSVLGIGIWVGTIQNMVSTNSGLIEKNEQRSTVNETRLNFLEVNNSEVRARLASIEVTLQEIKTAIIKLQ